MSQWVKDKARLRFGKTVTNGLDDWFRHQHRLCPADLKGTKVKKFRKRHVQKWKSCKALTSKREKELMSSVFRHYNNCVMLHTYIHYVCLYFCNLWHRMPPQLVAGVYFAQFWLKYFFLHLQRQLLWSYAYSASINIAFLSGFDRLEPALYPKL